MALMALMARSLKVMALTASRTTLVSFVIHSMSVNYSGLHVCSLERYELYEHARILKIVRSPQILPDPAAVSARSETST